MQFPAHVFNKTFKSFNPLTKHIFEALVYVSLTALVMGSQGVQAEISFPIKHGGHVTFNLQRRINPPYLDQQESN